MAGKTSKKTDEKDVQAQPSGVDQPTGDVAPSEAKADAVANDDNQGTRAGGTVTEHQPDADIAAVTGSLAGEALDEPNPSGTVERTPIIGEPEEVVSDGLDDDAPRFGPAHARAADEKAK